MTVANKDYAVTTRHTGIRPWLAAAVLAAAALAGCASDDAMQPAGSQSSFADGAIDTGTFPNLNIPPKVANEQISPEQKAARIAELSAAQQRQSAGGAAGVPGEDPVLLKKIAATHGEDTLKQIEGN
jgi:hypothetical protein